MAKVRIDDIEIDATLTERHSTTTEITKHPVEVGASPTDHARKMPKRVVVEGLLTNTSVNSSEQNARGGASAPGDAGAAQTLFNALRELQDSRRAVSIETSLTFYDSMMMTSLEVPRDARSGDAVRFTAQFEQIVFVSSGMARLAPRPSDLRKPVDKTDQGKKQPTPVTDPGTVDRLRSTLRVVTNKARGLPNQ